MRSMRPPVDIGPCQVRGPGALSGLSRARVMWEDGLLYVARSAANVTYVACPQEPIAPRRASENWVANTTAGPVSFKRRGCSCGYRLGNTAFATLVDAATALEGVESTSTPVEAAAQTLTEADTP